MENENAVVSPNTETIDVTITANIINLDELKMKVFKQLNSLDENYLHFSVSHKSQDNSFSSETQLHLGDSSTEA